MVEDTAPTTPETTGTTETTVTPDITERLQQALERIRPAIQMDGGDIHLVDWNPEEKLVRVALSGACVGCHMASMTMVMGVERVIKQMVPEVVAVEAIQ